ncbi:PorP/SprF family type IX secretion system membrane protein [Myroides odoratimimus]|uniref:Bacteroidetes-specific putative membrane protein n=1 Tax=Myroides odoratimimus CIP 101113 TaxID=883154 RepID=A0AAV3F1W6_9FLAO|nr:type IX secretion system membrane protein PorP/SprF [Myroides odoratimimus]EHO09903.1 bacteroidetes-specific putative membrane protein [Myroides odoratimimus CIP 101113]
MKIKQILKRILFVSLSVFSTQVYAQQDPQYTQYMYNHSNINPAYVGSNQGINIFGAYRSQWVGLEGAPKTATFSVTTPLKDSGLGMGVNFVNDRLGVTNNNTLSMDLSYAIDLNYKYKLALGLKASASLLDVNFTKLDIYNPSDPLVKNDINNKFSPNIAAGMFLYSEKAYVGLSVVNLLNNFAYDKDNISLFRQRPHMYVTAGYVFDLNQDIKFKPATMIKMLQGSSLQVDLSGNFMFANKFTAGLGYRLNGAVSGLVGLQISEDIFLGYSYDADTTSLASYNSGSHEVFMRFTLFNRLKRINAPRFF